LPSFKVVLSTDISAADNNIMKGHQLLRERNMYYCNMN
jgi:hypothetical protein